MATWLNVKKKDIELKELHEIFDNSPKNFYIKYFDGENKNHYEIEIRHNEGIDVKKEFFKELDRIRKEHMQTQQKESESINKKLIELTEKFNKRLDVIIKANPEENFIVESREKSAEMLKAKLYKLRGNKHPLQNQAISYLEENILNLRTEERNFEIQQGKSFDSLFVSDSKEDNLLTIFERLQERKKELNMEKNQEFNSSEFLTNIKINFSAEEKAFLREILLSEFNQNEFSPIVFKQNSNISEEGIERVENFYNKFKQENYTPVSEEDLEKYGWNYSNFYVDEKFENKVDNVLKAMEYDENIRTEINAVYLKIKSNIHTKNETMTNKRLEEEMGTYELINYLAGGRRFTADNKKITFTNEELIAKYNEFSDYQKQFFKEKGIREAINQIEEVLESSISKERANSISQNFNDFYKMVAENEKILNAVNEDLKNYKNSTGKAVELNSEQQQMVDEDINKIEKNVGMNARQAIEVNQEKTEDLLNSSIEMAKKFNISVLEAIDKKVQIYQRHSKSATESTAWQLRGDNAIKSYLNSLKETNNKEYMNTNNQNQEQNSAQNEQKEFNKVEYLKNQIKYLGFGESEQLHKNLEKSLNSNEESFILNTTSDRVMDGNKVEFNLKFNKTKEGGVFFNSYEAKLTTKQGEERSHSFKVQKENSITAKEAINLLEGRAVKVHFNKTNEKVDEQTGEITKEVIKEPSFIKLKLNEEKNEYGNYKLEAYQNRGYGIDINTIIEKANLVFANDSEKEKTIKHLEKGNITNVNFLNDKMQQQKGFAVFNPQWKMLNLYDEKMNRVNSNKNAQKSDLQDNQKNNVREQSNKRSL